MKITNKDGQLISMDDIAADILKMLKADSESRTVSLDIRNKEYIKYISKFLKNKGYTTMIDDYRLLIYIK